MSKLKPKSDAARSRGCGILFGLFFIGTALPGLIASIMNLAENAEGEGFPFVISLLCTSLFVVIGLAIVGASVIPWISEWRIGKPEVSVSPDTVRLGDRFSIAYSQTFKRKAEVRGIQVSLVKRETATYSSGTSSTTVTHEETAARFDGPAKTYEAGEPLVFTRSLEIPRDGMHTFRSNHNEIAWLLQVKVDIAGWPDYRDYFEIRVPPIRA